MAHDVFLCYSDKDKTVADALCAKLEARRIRCWIAPRDILPGMIYAEALIEALNQSRILILVFSANSNNSPQVMREIERAVHLGIPIIPFRIEDVVPSKAMEFFLGAPHWLDALTPPLEKHVETLGRTVEALLTSSNLQNNTMPEYRGQVNIKSKKRNSIGKKYVLFGSLLILAIISAVVFLLNLSGNFSSVTNIATGLTKPTITIIIPSSSSVKPRSQTPNLITPQTQIAFQDGFSNSSSGWKTNKQSIFESGYSNGEYYILIKNPNTNVVCSNSYGPFINNFTYEIGARLMSGPSQSGYGITFRHQNDLNFYRFLVWENGYYMVQKCLDGIYFGLQGKTSTEFIKQGNNSNHLKVVCKDTQIDVYVNGIYLTTIIDNSISDGKIGLSGISPQNESNTYVVFDNCVVYR
jgi:hypothetical protein